ncbi:3-isopropylmalate dehydratase, small subunit [Desulfosporosinus acidiphilus SJ4]|uniref:3-isopropylmalate dehydratase small subunit n=1 Tax=Desulfosporosinus acidiphilus (strain DSM 22704 / JCM 16185 / SJ4) TaxID=646529 RepID=I4D8M3_DESAJ|nr:3-isopropylmalate dehydratase small subunit [Desulfosporosinus acidiphilus]AFM42147.1 3-isopropylmalate dehydratase, small subunit [Desulfosporosinus acidiphilus SJ4]
MGKAWKFGHDIDTDVIIPARYLNQSTPEHLAVHCMEDAGTKFAEEVSSGDIMVGGKNFGCGSSREHAPIAIKACGIKVVIAESFARIFYRNSLNIGLPILECPEAVAGISQGDDLDVDLTTGKIINKTTGSEFQARPFPPFMQELIRAGGLIPYVRGREENA